MFNKQDKNKARQKRHLRVRNHISGTAERPRLNVFRSLSNIYAQVIDDVNGVTLAAADGKKLGFNASKQGATEVAKVFAETLKAKNVTKVVYDRNGYLYHGVVAAFADGLRANGIVL